MGQQVEHTVNPQPPPNPCGSFNFLRLRRGRRDPWLELVGEPRALVSCTFLKRLTLGHRGNVRTHTEGWRCTSCSRETWEGSLAGCQSHPGVGVGAGQREGQRSLDGKVTSGTPLSHTQDALRSRQNPRGEVGNSPWPSEAWLPDRPLGCTTFPTRQGHRQPAWSPAPSP